MKSQATEFLSMSLKKPKIEYSTPLYINIILRTPIHVLVMKYTRLIELSDCHSTVTGPVQSPYLAIYEGCPKIV